MPSPKDEGKRSTALDRRAVIRGALAVGGASVLVGSEAAAMPQTIVTEREWARALARHIVNQLPEAIRQVRDVQLTDTQIEEIQRAFQNTLVNNMGCEVPTT